MGRKNHWWGASVRDATGVWISTCRNCGMRERSDFFEIDGKVYWLIGLPVGVWGRGLRRRGACGSLHQRATRTDRGPRAPRTTESAPAPDATGTPRRTQRALSPLNGTSTASSLRRRPHTERSRRFYQLATLMSRVVQPPPSLTAVHKYRLSSETPEPFSA